MSKKDKTQASATADVKKENKGSFSLNDLNNKTLWIFTGILTIVYFIFSTFSDGFYMHDEPMFYLYAKELLQSPQESLLSFQKLGYILYLALPSLGGFTFLHFCNSLLSAVTVMYSYKIVQKLGGKNSFLVFFILGLQPLWFMLAFRNFSEFLTAFVLVMAAWNHFNKKYIFAAFLVSYAALTRQEYHILLGLYFWILVFKKQWIAALSTGVLTVLHNFMGYFITDDILYLPNQVIKYSHENNSAYPKRGFDYYFIMSNVVFGATSLVLFINYIGISILKKKLPNLILLIPVLITFLLYCVFNHTTWDIGVGGGNLRYVLPIAPFMVILGVLSIDEIAEYGKKYLTLIFLLPLLLLITIYQTYDHDFMKLLEDGDRYWMPFVLALATIVILMLPLKSKQYLLTFGLISVILIVSTARTFNLNPEDATMKKAGEWFSRYLEKNKNVEGALFTEDSRITSGHILFFYYSNKYKSDYKNRPVIDITKEVTDTLKKGDIVVWDSHYGYRPELRPTSQPYDFYDKNPDFEKIQYYQSKDNRFLIAFFRKVKD